MNNREGYKKVIPVLGLAGFLVLEGCLPPKQIVALPKPLPAQIVETKPPEIKDVMEKQKKLEELIRRLEAAEQRLLEAERKMAEAFKKIEKASEKTEKVVERIKKAQEKIDAVSQKATP